MFARLTSRRPLRRLAALAAATLLATAGLAATATPAQAASPVVGQGVCHSSLQYGWQCGPVTAVNLTIVYGDQVITRVFRYQACAGPGDNGTRVYNSQFETVGYVIASSGAYPYCSTFALPWPVRSHGAAGPAALALAVGR